MSVWPSEANAAIDRATLSVRPEFVICGAAVLDRGSPETNASVESSVYYLISRRYWFLHLE